MNGWQAWAVVLGLWFLLSIPLAVFIGRIIEGNDER